MEQLYNEACEELSLAKGIPSGVEKIQHIENTLQKIDVCYKNLIVCKQTYRDSLKWKLNTIKLVHVIEIDNFVQAEKIQDLRPKLVNRFCLKKLGDIGRKGYDALIDIFPNLMAGERARLHNAMSKIFFLRVTTGTLVIRDEDERAKFITKPTYDPETYEKWIKDAFDCIAVAEKGMVRARFYKDESLRLEHLVKSLEKEAEHILFEGIDTPLGYDPFSSKLQLPAFFRRIKGRLRKKKRSTAKESNDEEYSLEEMDQVLLALEKEEAELDRSLIE